MKRNLTVALVLVATHALFFTWGRLTRPKTLAEKKKEISSVASTTSGRSTTSAEVAKSAEKLVAETKDLLRGLKLTVKPDGTQEIEQTEIVRQARREEAKEAEVRVVVKEVEKKIYVTQYVEKTSQKTETPSDRPWSGGVLVGADVRLMPVLGIQVERAIGPLSVGAALLNPLREFRPLGMASLRLRW